ncbi:MAG: hypothetical protein ABIS51_09985 [Sphingomonas sp.]
MLKPLLAAALLLLPSVTQAQDRELPPVTHPVIAAVGADAKAFVPQGWTLEQQQAGDLNGDGLSDLALALHQQDPRNIIPNPGGFCGETLDTNPRILAVALAQPGGGYRLAMQNHSLVPRRDNPCAEDWFSADSVIDGGIEIKHGALQVRLSLFMGAGGWDMGYSVFTFRWQRDALRLIGFDSTNTQRNSGEAQTLSINYLTRRVRTGRGSMENDRETVRWSTLPARAPLTIDQVGDGMAFDPSHP